MRQVVSFTRVFHVVLVVMVLMETTSGTVYARKLLQMVYNQQAPQQQQANQQGQIGANQPLQYVNQPVKGLDLDGMTRYGQIRPGQIVAKQPPLQYENQPRQGVDLNGMTRYGPMQPGQIIGQPQQQFENQQLQRPDMDFIPMYIPRQVPPQQMKSAREQEFQRAFKPDLAKAMNIQSQRLTNQEIRAGLMYQAVPLVQRPVQVPIVKRAVIRRKTRLVPGRRPSPLKKLPLKRRPVKRPKPKRRVVQSKAPLAKVVGKPVPLKPAETVPKISPSE